MFHSSLARSGTRGELSIVSGSRTHLASAGLVLVGEPPIIPSRGAERACQCEHAAVHLSVPIRSFPAKTAPRTLTDAVTVSVVPRHRVGLRAVSCAHTVSFQEGSRLPLPQRLVRVQVAPHPCRCQVAPHPRQCLVEEGRGRAESPTPLGTDSRPQTFSPFSAPRGRQ